MADNIDGLPDVDLQPVIDDLKAQDKDLKTKDVKSDEHPEGNEFGQFKNKEAQIEGYKELQGFATRVSQENKDYKRAKEEMERKIAELEDRIEMSKGSNFDFSKTDDTDKSFDQRLAESPEKTLNQHIMEQVSTMSIAEVLEEEKDKDEAGFRERYAYVQMLAREYPHLVKTGRGVRKLFERADKVRTEETKKGAYKSLELILGEPPTEEQITKFKTLIKGESTEQPKVDTAKGDAFMPDTTSSTHTGADQDQKKTFKKDLSEAVEKGDVDGAIEAVFKEALES